MNNDKIVPRKMGLLVDGHINYIGSHHTQLEVCLSGIHNRYENLMRDEIEAHKKSEVQWGACYYYSSTFPFAEVYSDCFGGLLKQISSLLQVSSGLS